MLLAFLTSSIVNSVIQLYQASRYSNELLEQYIYDTEQRIDFQVKQNFLLINQDLVSRITENQEITLDEFMNVIFKGYDISEINIINPEGIIIESTQPVLVGYRMDRGEQSWDFFENIVKTGEYAQNCQGASYNSELEMAYSGVRMEDGNYLQIGVTKEAFKMYITDFLKESTNHIHVGLNGDVIVIDKEGEVISSNQQDMIGKNVKDVSEELMMSLEKLTQNNDGSIQFQEMRINNVTNECAVGIYYENYLVAVQSQKETFQSQIVAVVASVIAELIVFIVLLIYIYHLIEKRVVRNVYDVNDALSEITAGKLDTLVDVRESAEFAVLSDDINNMVSSLKKYADKQKQIMEKEIFVASTIQLSVLPGVFPPFPERKEFDLYATMHPAKAVGGDFYDFFFVSDDILALLIADVSGKGVPAAMFMMVAKTMIKNLAESGLPVDEVMNRANDKLCKENASGMFVTVWMGYLNVKTGHLTYVNAGHNKPLLCHGENGYTYLKNRSGLAIALMEGVKYKIFETNLERGDRLYLYTDGITEANNCQEELYSEERLEQYLNQTNQAGKLSPKETCEGVKADIDAFAAGTEQFDDMTMLALNYFGTEEKIEEITIDAQVDKFPLIHAFLVL